MHPEVEKTLGFEEFTPIQELSIPSILDGKNCLLIAPTGSGKTEAAVAPIFSMMLDGEESKGIEALYITPLRALNRDILKRILLWGEELGIKVGVRHGDTPQSERTEQSRSPPRFLITTPETFQILMTGKRLREHLKRIRCVVVDELHEFLGDKRGSQLVASLERLVDLAGLDFQRIGLSATIGEPEKAARFLVGVDRKVEIIEAPLDKGMRIGIEHPEGILSDAVIERIRELVLEHESTLIFVNTRETAELLAARFKILDPGLPVGVHHGSLSREARLEAETRFKNGTLKGLICTSSMELGIDIGSVDLVIQYNSPRQVTRLIQRVGRSGHTLDKVSVGTIIATDPDDIAEAAIIVSSDELEEIKIHENPLDVLANQLYGMALTERVVSAPGAYAALKRSYPFRNLKWNTLVRVLRQLKDIGNVWWDEDRKEFSKRRGVYTQYYGNISMIPDEKSYRLVDITSNKGVGTLDESFVLGYGGKGAPFICGGAPWQVVETDEEKLLVKAAPAKDLTGAIPSWVGEEIPVSFDIAQGIGKLREEISKLPEDEAMEWILGHYPIDKNSAQALVDFISDQKETDSLIRAPVPTDRVVTVEMKGLHVVINALFGHKVNETLALLISSVISTRLGAQVLTNVQPYRITLELPGRIKKDEVERTLRSLEPKNVEWMLTRILKNSSAFQYRLVQIAKKFGFLDKDFSRRLPKRVLEIMRESVMFDEAVREVQIDRLDAQRTREVLKRIEKGEIEISNIPFISPIGRAGERYALSLVTPRRADKAILEGLKNRLMKTGIRECCINCGWNSRRSVETIELRCPKCTSQMLAVLSPYDESYKLLKKKRLTREEKRDVRKMAKNAGLVVSYGKKGAMVMAGRGIGPDTASRILRIGKDEISLLRDVLGAEINYARTKRFWD